MAIPIPTRSILHLVTDYHGLCYLVNKDPLAGGPMASCPKCGSSVSNGAAFCGVCGSPVSPIYHPVDPAAPGNSAGLSSNAAGALCYLVGLITGIVFLVLEPYRRDRFVRFHAFQSILYCVAYIIFWILWSDIILAALFSSGFLLAVFTIIGRLVSLAFIIYWLFLMYKAYREETYMIPVIGEMASKMAAKQASSI